MLQLKQLQGLGIARRGAELDKIHTRRQRLQGYLRIVFYGALQHDPALYIHNGISRGLLLQSRYMNTCTVGGRVRAYAPGEGGQTGIADAQG